MLVRHGCWASEPMAISLSFSYSDEDENESLVTKKMDMNWEKVKNTEKAEPSQNRYKAPISREKGALIKDASGLHGTIIRHLLEVFEYDEESDGLQDADALRTRARALAKERAELFQKASETYHAHGRQVRGSAASYYSEKAHALGRQIRRLDQHAARAIFLNNNAAPFNPDSMMQTDDKETVIVDFHGLYVSEVQSLTHRLLEFWAAFLRTTTPPSSKVA